MGSGSSCGWSTLCAGDGFHRTSCEQNRVGLSSTFLELECCGSHQHSKAKLLLAFHCSIVVSFVTAQVRATRGIPLVFCRPWVDSPSSLVIISTCCTRWSKLHEISVFSCFRILLEMDLGYHTESTCDDVRQGRQAENLVGDLKVSVRRRRHEDKTQMVGQHFLFLNGTTRQDNQHCIGCR